jgi:hypothetical protein
LKVRSLAAASVEIPRLTESWIVSGDVKPKAEKVASRGLPAPVPEAEAGVNLIHVSDSESEVDTSLPPSTAPLG